MAKTLETTKVRGWKRYPAKQPLSLDWPMEIPDHWRSHRLKEVADARPSNVDKKTVEGDIPVQLCNYVAVYKNRAITADMDFMQATATPSQVEQFSIHADDVIITKDSEAWDDIGVPAHVPKVIENLVCGYHLTLVRPNPQKLLGAYLARCFESEGLRDQFCVAANGVTRYGLGTQEIKCFVLPVPPISEQRAIAAFLDRETARIDALIARKQRLIELLEEKRQAAISHAVTKGTNPVAKLKGTKSPFYDEIPSNWQMISIRSLVWQDAIEMQDGNHGEIHPKADDYVPHGIPFIMANCMDDGALDLVGCKYISEELARSLRIGFAKPGDVLLSHKGTIGEVAVVPQDLAYPFLVLTPQVTYYRIKDCKKLNSEFLSLFFQSKPFQNQLRLLAGGQATRDSLSLLNQRALTLILPPIEEQLAIVKSTSRVRERLNEAKSKIRLSIDALLEYRTALISAAVTGQIDVREEVRIDG